jgi:hypothetical protein
MDSLTACRSTVEFADTSSCFDEDSTNVETHDSTTSAEGSSLSTSYAKFETAISLAEARFSCSLEVILHVSPS